MHNNFYNDVRVQRDNKLSLTKSPQALLKPGRS